MHSRLAKFLQLHGRVGGSPLFRTGLLLTLLSRTFSFTNSALSFGVRRRFYFGFRALLENDKSSLTARLDCLAPSLSAAPALPMESLQELVWRLFRMWLAAWCADQDNPRPKPRPTAWLFRRAYEGSAVPGRSRHFSFDSQSRVVLENASV